MTTNEQDRAGGQAAANTDTEIWRGRSGANFGDDDRFYADSLFIPKSEVEALGINCGGHVIVKPIREWHALAAAGVTVEPSALREALELDDETRWILGRPCFDVGGIAELMRKDGWAIRCKAEDEQATVAWWSLGLYRKHGKDWRTVAVAELKSMAERAKARAALSAEQPKSASGRVGGT